jgi:cytoskeletal protein CcmA (bactofilin family)
MWPFRDSTREIPTFPAESTIGAGNRARGDLSGPDGFRVDGHVEGSIESEGPVVVGERGSVDGGIHGRDVVILGRVRGDIEASGHLEIGPKGKVLGDITVKSFRMHAGGVFRGASRMTGGEEAATTTTLALAAPATVLSSKQRGRTLPPPNGAVPPPPAVGDLAVAPALPPPVPAVAVAAAAPPDAAVSQQRLVRSSDVQERRPTGT